jgi:hypothetical protein
MSTAALSDPTWAATTGRNAEISPKAKARLAGFFLLVTVVLGIYAQGFISLRLVVPDDAAATAANILAHESLFRLAFALYLIEMTCQVTMTVLFYDLLKPVNKSVSLLTAILGLVGCTVKILSRLFFYAPLLILKDVHYLSVFDPKQLQALALLFLRVNEYAAAMAMIFFGFQALLKGYLITRSTFLPRILGVAIAAGGAGWLAFLSPPLGYRLFPYVAMLALVTTLAMVLWLLVRGVDEDRWKEQAVAAASSIWR